MAALPVDFFQQPIELIEGFWANLTIGRMLSYQLAGFKLAISRRRLRVAVTARALVSAQGRA
jgi:hypothetical protein